MEYWEVDSGRGGDITLNCSDCRFYNSEEKECRRRAPNTDEGGSAVWPGYIEGNEWCGEYEQAMTTNVTGNYTPKYINTEDIN